MKKLILMLAIVSCLAFSTVKAQTVNSVKLSELTEEYLEVSQFRFAGSGQVYVAVDYGQKRDVDNFREIVVKDEKGKRLPYASMIDFINKMKPNGYELFHVYSLSPGDNSSVIYILKRKSC